MPLNRMRWVAVIVPVIFIGVLDLVTDHEWSDLVTNPINTLAVPIIALVAAIYFARVTYRRIDRLTADLRDRNATLERRNASLEAIERIGTAVATARPIEEIFASVLAVTRESVGAEGASITLRTDGGERTVACAGGPAGAAETTLTAPLRRGEASIGTLSAWWGARERALSSEGSELLLSLANEVAVALERDRLSGELRELAVRSERERIAREMHDGLAQVLGYVNTKAQAAEEMLSAERPADARRQLAELSAAARSVYVDVREAILGLKSPAAFDRGLVEALEDYAARFSEASKIATTVSATAAAQRLDIASGMEAEIVRVVREALTNVRKHSAAHRVRLELTADGRELVVRVADDGVGLAATPATPTDWPHYGMRMMREGAAAIGGSVTWSSHPHAGTVVSLRVPVGARAGVAP